MKKKKFCPMGCFIAPKEIQNLPLIYLPIYKPIVFSGSSDKKNFFRPWASFALKTEEIFFGLMTPKKKLAYILVNGLMANFDFQDYRTKNLNFSLSKFYSFWTTNPKF